MYKRQINNITERYSSEFIFKILNDSLYELDVHYFYYFALFAFVQLFLLLYSLKKEAFLWPFLILSLFGGHFFIDWMNAMRQEMAACIMLFGVNFIISRNPLKYLACVIFAIGFHISAVIFLAVYPICAKCKNLTPNIPIQEVLVCICAISTILIDDIVSKVFPIIKSLEQIDFMANYALKYNCLLYTSDAADD